jgi:hypothetical protein
MARTNIPIQTIPAFGGKINTVTWTNADTANGMVFVNDGKTLLLMKLTDTSNKTVTVSSVADPYGRTGDTAITVPLMSAGEDGVSIAGPFDPALFNQRGASDLGKVFVGTSADTGLKLAAIQIS